MAARKMAARKRVPRKDTTPLRVKIIETRKLGRNVVPAALFTTGTANEYVVRYSQPPANNVALQVFCHPGKTFDTPVALIGNGVVQVGKKMSVELLFPDTDGQHVIEGSVIGYQSWDAATPHMHESPKELYILPPGTKCFVASPPASPELLNQYQEIYPGCVLLVVSGEQKMHRVYVFVPGGLETAPILPEFETEIAESRGDGKMAVSAAKKSK